MLANQQSYEHGLADLKLVCESYIDTLRKKAPLQKLGNYITLCDRTNADLKYSVADVQGISIEKKFIDTKANMEGVSLAPYAVVEPNEFAYVTVTSRNGGKISLARNSSSHAYICSSSYVVFKIINTKKLLPEYLSMLFERRDLTAMPDSIRGGLQEKPSIGTRCAALRFLCRTLKSNRTLWTSSRRTMPQGNC